MPLKFPATLLPDEKIYRFHLARYGSGLVLVGVSLFVVSRFYVEIDKRFYNYRIALIGMCE
jgi:hypothetical protein